MLYDYFGMWKLCKPSVHMSVIGRFIVCPISLAFALTFHYLHVVDFPQLVLPTGSSKAVPCVIMST